MVQIRPSYRLLSEMLSRSILARKQLLLQSRSVPRRIHRGLFERRPEIRLCYSDISDLLPRVSPPSKSLKDVSWTMPTNLSTRHYTCNTNPGTEKHLAHQLTERCTALNDPLLVARTAKAFSLQNDGTVSTVHTYATTTITGNLQAYGVVIRQDETNTSPRATATKTSSSGTTAAARQSSDSEAGGSSSQSSPPFS